MSTGTCNVKSTRACRRSIGLEGNMRGSVSGRSQGARDTAYSGRTVRGARARALKRRIYIRATRIAVDRSQIGSRRLNETRGVSVAAPSFARQPLSSPANSRSSGWSHRNAVPPNSVGGKHERVIIASDCRSTPPVCAAVSDLS